MKLYDEHNSGMRQAVTQQTLELHLTKKLLLQCPWLLRDPLASWRKIIHMLDKKYGND